MLVAPMFLTFSLLWIIFLDSIKIIRGTPMTEPQPQSTLTPRQEAFCQNYITEPTATRAAVLAGYAEHTANKQASRLLTKVDILARVAELRREQGLVYRVEADSLLDKLEAVYHTAMADRKSVV